MNQKSKLVFGAMFVLFCGLYLSNGAFGQTLPDGPGKAEFIQFCTGCHSVNTATTPGQTKEEWRATVQRMVNRGADGTDEQLNEIVRYLSTNFGPETPDPAATPQPTTPSSTPPATPSSNSGGPAARNLLEIQRVKRIIAASGSLKCPRIQQQRAH